MVKEFLRGLKEGRVRLPGLWEWVFRAAFLVGLLVILLRK